MLTAAFGLFLLHTIEIWAWAAAYWLMGLLAGWESIYFSTTTYATLGYGDIVLSRGGRLFGAIEGANGFILQGWSTAFFFNIVDRLKLLETRDRARRLNAHVCSVAGLAIRNTAKSVSAYLPMSSSTADP